jgi:YHS domain-containing protein
MGSDVVLRVTRRRFAATMLAGVALGVLGTWTRLALADDAAAKPATRVALGGYDPVSYFTEPKPVKGTSEFTFAFDDTVYWFASADHRASFAADPERYAPQFDGYCAITLSRGTRAEADPEAYAIRDGKLYVFQLKKGVQKFAAEAPEIIAKATDNWQTTRSQ